MNAADLFAALERARDERRRIEDREAFERWREANERQSYELAEVRRRARQEHDDALLGLRRRGPNLGRRPS